MKRFEARKAYLACLVILTVFISMLSACGGGGGGHWYEPNVPKVTVVSIEVTPVTSTIPVGNSQQYRAMAKYSDGTSRDVTTDPTTVWTPATPAVASVGVHTGLARGLAAGTSQITAAFGGKTSPPVILTVYSATLLSIAVIPNLASIPVGGSQQFSAIATYDFGPSLDVTADPTTVWTPATPAVASVGLHTGLARGLAPGISNITAAFGGKTSPPAILTVYSATLLSIAVIPATASVPVGGSQQFTAIATYDFGPSRDVTADPATVWNAGSPLVASFVSNPGKARGLAAGTSNITAAFGGKTSLPAILTVYSATLLTIDVMPATASIQVGGSQQFTAIATYDFGPSRDVTADPATVWTAGSPLVASFVSDPGKARGLTPGISNITAAFGGKTSLPAVLTVTAIIPIPGVPGPAGAVNLLTTEPFGIIAWDAITNSGGASHIYGDVALTQSTADGGTVASVVGFALSGVAPLLASPIVTDSAGVTPGVISAANNGTPAQIAALPQLLVDLRAVYDNLMARPAPITPLTTPASALGVSGGTFTAAANDLSGYILSPGIYTATGAYGLSEGAGPLVLDAGGNPDAVFIIRSTSAASGFTSTTGSVVLQNGAQSKNVFWVLNNATIGGATFFQGTVVAGHVITLNPFAIVEGRMLAGALGTASGAITLSGTNVISVPK